MRAKPSSNSRTGKSNRTNGKSNGGNSRGVLKKNKHPEKKPVPDLSVLRQPVDTSICGLKQAVKVFETGTPEVLHLLTYDCDVVYECKVCRNLFRSIANFISHKRVYCTLRYSRSQDLSRSKPEGEDYTVILGEQATERLPTRITARKDLTSIVESLGGQRPGLHLYPEQGQAVPAHNGENKKTTTVHLEPIDNTNYGVFQTVLKPDSQDLMRSQVKELHNLLSQNEVVLGPDGRILQNGFSDSHQDEAEAEANSENSLICSECNIKFANRKTLTKHKRLMHEAVRTSYSCPCCKNYFAHPWSVYRHLYKVHRKTNEQVRRLRAQIHKKDIRVDKTVINNAGSKKMPSPSKKKVEAELHQRIQQDNKEWIGHFEDDGELQRCGGCGRKFERKAALISHSQICQKRIAAYNRIEQNHHVTTDNNTMALVPITSSAPCSKKPMPKPSPEKKIGIQVRMNYCKSNSPCGGAASVVSGRQSCSRSVLGDESDIEAVSVDGKDSFFQLPIKNSVELKESLVLEQFFKNANQCRAAEGVEKVNSYLNNSANGIDKVHTYEISTCKRSTVLRSHIGKNKSLEAKCLQLRSALENGITNDLRTVGRDKDVENTLFDGNIDNSSESNTSAISSLSSQLTPLVDKGYVCEVEESIEIKNINISRTLENIPRTEADSTSMTNGGLHMTYNSHTYTGNLKLSPNGEATCEEVSTSVVTDDIPPIDSNLHIDSSCLNDDEISVDMKPVALTQQETKNGFQELELENTISILTRNQLKAICKDDLLPIHSDRKGSLDSGKKKFKKESILDSASKEIMLKKLSKYVDQNKSECCICKKRVKNLNQLYIHVITHTRWRRYECLYNGCTFQSFIKRSCFTHAMTHLKENSDELAQDLVGLIAPSKWNLSLVDRPKRLPPAKSVKAVIKARSVARHKDSASQKLVKTVRRLSRNPLNPNVLEKGNSKFKIKQENKAKKREISSLLNKTATKQKLLTDFKNFSEVPKLNGKSVPQSVKKAVQSPKKKPLVNNISPTSIKPNPVENGVSSKDNSPTSFENSLTKKRRRLSVSTADQPKRKSSSVKEVSVVIKKEVVDDEIIVNHFTADPSASISVKGRSSRASSRKSSANSDQQKSKSSISPVVILEDASSLLNCAPNNFESSNTANIQSAQIVDGSLEEEESQESDKPVDDSHLKKIFMEVIFGPPAKPVVSPGRPVRNKTRPKRDSDFILGSERDAVDGKLVLSKKTGKSSSDSKPLPEITRKTK